MLKHLIIYTLFLAFIPVSYSQDLKGTKPNIILILTDDQGKGQLGCQGHPWLETPNIDKLFSESTYFSDFHMSPTCAPSRAALLTGNVPFKNGVTHTGGARARMTLDVQTLPEILKGTGYTTGIFGKWHLGYEEAYQPGSRGFDEVFIHGYGGIGQPMDVPNNKYDNPIIRHNGKFVQTEGFCTDVFFDQALAWIKKSKDKPFFAYISTNAPHSPYVAPKSKRQKFAQYGYKKSDMGFYGMIENIDDNVGKLMAKIKAWELDEKTLIIFMSDNGFAELVTNKQKLGSKNGEDLFAYQGGLKGFKKTPNEGGTLVPAFFRWKGTLKEGQEIKNLSAHIDFLPTLVDLAGVKIEEKRDGQSLVPLLANADAKFAQRNLFFHIGRWGNNVGPEGSQYDKRPGRAGFAVRNTKFRLVNHEELYDIKSDPSEKNNVAEQYPEIVQEMQKSYDTWWSEVRPYMINEGHQKMEPNPFHLKYKEQLKTKDIPLWDVPQL
ncbi:arylsulfatase [Lentisphaera profundi]|uniref:Arylsulfatase n=1 Tax=Lentisphaera profundi TaxID=1658616 RepID=A0ABY7VT22_9BACT|nr:arylsulfatase [Lentisphaera profundi]WDE97202.1 arylsulfatase [Lentisphaera profundi]